jgi:hypothetical protein
MLASVVCALACCRVPCASCTVRATPQAATPRAAAAPMAAAHESAGAAKDDVDATDVAVGLADGVRFNVIWCNNCAVVDARAAGTS